MAVTSAGAQLTQEYRLGQIRLRAELLSELQVLWGLYDPTDPASFDRFVTAATRLIADRRADSARLGAAYYTQFRADEGFGYLLDPATAPGVSAEQVAIAMRATALQGVVDATRAGITVPQALRVGFVRGAGAASRLALNGGRETIISNVGRETTRVGWQRITSGSPCYFCAMLASRGPVYRSQRTADFQAHDHCSCTPEPAFPGSEWPAANVRFAEQWDTATAGLSGKDAISAFRSALSI
jgi:hypothetical protein